MFVRVCMMCLSDWVCLGLSGCVCCVCLTGSDWVCQGVYDVFVWLGVTGFVRVCMMCLSDWV